MDERFDNAAYDRDGFGLLRGAIPAPLLAALRAAVQRVQDEVATLPPPLLERLTFERDLPAHGRGGIGAERVGDAVFILGDPVAFDAVFWEVLRQPRLVAAVRAAVGVPDVAAHFMNVTVKHPRFGRRIGWHRDFPNGYASPPTPCFVRAMLCLDGMTAEGGATAFLPGSHRLEEAEAAAPPKGWQPADGAAVHVACDPGDLVLIHPRVLHGGGMNATAAPRRNLILQAGDAAVPLRAVPAQEGVSGHRLGPA